MIFFFLLFSTNVIFSMPLHTTEKNPNRVEIYSNTIYGNGMKQKIQINCQLKT